jgi:hypothetical protein
MNDGAGMRVKGNEGTGTGALLCALKEMVDDDLMSSMYPVKRTDRHNGRIVTFNVVPAKLTLHETVRLRLIEC